MDYGEFEAAAVNVRELKTAVFRTEAMLAAAACENGAKSVLAELWACSAQHINTLARVFDAFGAGDIHPDVPLSLYRAALDTNDPHVWLRRALAEGWSARELRDAADVEKGRRRSRVKLADCDAGVLMWQGFEEDGEPFARIELLAEGLEPSGEPPRKVRFRAWELL